MLSAGKRAIGKVQTTLRFHDRGQEVGSAAHGTIDVRHAFWESDRPSHSAGRGEEVSELSPSVSILDPSNSWHDKSPPYFRRFIKFIRIHKQDRVPLRQVGWAASSSL
jgi:hypothetical protein